MRDALHKKWSFLLKISSVNVDKSEEILLYWGNSQWKTLFSVQWWSWFTYVLQNLKRSNLSENFNCHRNCNYSTFPEIRGPKKIVQKYGKNCLLLLLLGRVGTVYAAKYSIMDQVKVFKGGLPQILLSPFLNTFSHIKSFMVMILTSLFWTYFGACSVKGSSHSDHILRN